MSKIARSISVIVVVMAFCAVALAGKHPVPLERKQDSATCIQCHEQKAKGKSVHTAIGTGCNSCHEVRVNKDVTRVKLLTSTSVSLCITCHADKNADQIKGKVHDPAVRDCVKCHDSHASDNKYQLLKAESGDSKSTNICLSCHEIGVDVPKDGSRHAALDMGCDTCHVTHKSGERGKREFDFHLTKDAPALCLDCHDPKSDALTKVHKGQPFDNANCLTCHDPHQSSQKHLMAKFTHAPFAGGQCDSCHQPAKSGKIVLTSNTARELCVTCHSDKAEEIEKAKVQHPGAAGDCTACHNPHAGKSPGFPKPDAVNVCLGCHADQAEQHKKAHLHQPAFEQGCSTCHEPHGGANPKLLRASSVNSLCLECHSPDAKPVKLESEHLTTIFGGKVKLPESYFASIPTLNVKYGLGHPVEKHPVVDQMDPNDVTKVRTEMGCAKCHQPHASAEPGLLLDDQPNNLAFCARCHKNLGN